jgi:hypothetical protein
MNWLRNDLLFLLAIMLITAAVIILAFFDNATQAAFGLLTLSTVLTAISSIATYMQALEARRQRENAERPEVAVYFQPTNRLMYCIIHNLGKLPARNISVRFDPSPVRNDGKALQDQSLFAKPVPFLPPNEKYWRHLAPSPTALQMNPNLFKIHVEYFSFEGVRYTDDFVVDLTIMAEANDPEPSIAYQLGKINDSLDALRKSLGKE